MFFAFLLKGLAVGIVIALPAGPVGLLCVRRTVVVGPLMGFVSGLGAALADTVFGAIAGFGLTFVRDSLLGYQDWLAVGGGVFLLYLGIRAIAHPPKPHQEPQVDEAERLLGAFASTFVLAITNPITILAFAAIFAKLGPDQQPSLLDMAALIGGVFLGSLVWWLGLSFGLGRLLRDAPQSQLRWLNRIAGALLTLSGVGLLISVALSAARAAL
jgi:threonine/homoserine/homoserine lactone efflux protein